MSSSSPVPIRVGINGFGRMGRLFLRQAWNHQQYVIVHINDVVSTVKSSAYLLTYDSIHGKWSIPVSHDDKTLIINNKHHITYTQQSNPKLIPWASMGVQLVIEASGAFTTMEKLHNAYMGHSESPHKILVSAPVSGACNIVMGINQYEYQPLKHNIITAASCTTNCLAPIIKVLHEEIGIVHGSITTIHNITNTQAMVDMPMKGDKDMRRMRSGVMSLVPTSTGSATAIALIFPELKGKLNGLAIRVPLLNSSITDVCVEMKRHTTKQEINAMLTKAAQTHLHGILGVETEPLVSQDFRGDTRSSIIDALSTMVIDGTQVKILAWYDNEMGYATRMAELAQLIASSLTPRARL